MDQRPSGTQFEIVHGEQHAVIVEVGGGVRAYDVGGVDVLQPYAVDQMCDGAHGAPLIPWPNRLGDGRYRFDGNDYQVALTEPEKQNAIHGFLRWRPWSCRENAGRPRRHDHDALPPGGLPVHPGRPGQLSPRRDRSQRHDHRHQPRRSASAVRLRATPLPLAGGGQRRRVHPAPSSGHPHPDRPATPAAHRPRGRRRNGLRLPRGQEDRPPRHR